MKDAVFTVMIMIAIGIIGVALNQMYIEKNEAPKRRLIAREKCIQDGGIIIDQHGGSAFTTDWVCHGAKP